ncbi:cell division protein DamX [Kosakonia sp. SMBL-WEM22]|uniref:cell division protein DamX n=1 Tax=Kosakonia sp. SMBL-WEM22 TaxID=2725560 RepID=UPI0016593138|nr:cell division protein DamX [Kosakonia sp. SMBL-WEM22]QNQ22198.1 cell division protein DamX [Kosakonia sp. SMBL-WEM22]
MDEFKPEDELKPDPSDRRTGRSRQSSERVDEPQINFDDVDVDADDRRPARTRRVRDEREEESYQEDEAALDEEPQERRPRKRKKAAAAAKPASRQYLMMGVGILVLLLLIIGIGSALKSPAPANNEQNTSGEKNIDLGATDNAAGNSGNAADQANGAQPAPGASSSQAQNAGAQQDVTLPPISSTPSQGQPSATPEGQNRVEVQGDLNNALSQPQSQTQLDSAASSTLPTEPATVAPIHNGNGNSNSTTARNQQPASGENRTTAPRNERKQMVIEPKPTAKTPVAKSESKAESRPVAQPPKRTESTASAPVKAPASTSTASSSTSTAASKPAQPKTTAPAATASSAPAASGTASTGNVGALKSAPGNHYTLQLSSSSNYNNLNAWAKKENLKNFVVYQTTRNGQPWYVLVSGVYASKDDAKRAVSALPADVQAKNPWAKPLHQVQADLK